MLRYKSLLKTKLGPNLTLVEVHQIQRKIKLKGEKNATDLTFRKDHSTACKGDHRKFSILINLFI